MDSKLPIIILGAGPAGLTAAFTLAEAGEKVILLEQEAKVGGISSSQRWNDFILEFGPHTYHVKRDRIDEIIRASYPGELPDKQRITKMLIRGKIFEYPLKFWQLVKGLNPLFSARLLADFLYTSLKYKLFPRPDDSFQTWGIKRFGTSLYNLCFGRYTEKVWGIPARRLSLRLASSKLHQLNLKDIIIKLLGGKGQEQATYWQDFIYPEEGMGTVFENMAARLREKGGEIWLKSSPAAISVKDGRVVAATIIRDGQEVRQECSSLLSTIPLTELTRLLRPYLQEEEYLAGMNLHNRSLVLVNIIFSVPLVNEAHWIYLIDPCFRFNRFCEQKNLLLDKKPYLRTMLTFEACCGWRDSFWNLPEEELKRLALRDAKLTGIIDTARAGDCRIKKVREAYPIYEVGFEENLNRLLQAASRVSNLFSTGRQGLFLNTDMHDTMEMGLLASRAALAGESSSAWYRRILPYLDLKQGGTNR